MTSKLLFSNLVNKGRQVLRGVLKVKPRDLDVKVVKTVTPIEKTQTVIRYTSLLPRSRLNDIWRNILPTIYYRSLARELGHQAAWRRARNLPLLSFVGLLVSQCQKDDDDDIASKIQSFVNKTDGSSSSLLHGAQQLSLDRFEFGQQIGQGCNAAVYEACIKSDDTQETPLDNSNMNPESSQSAMLLPTDNKPADDGMQYYVGEVDEGSQRDHPWETRDDVESMNVNSELTMTDNDTQSEFSLVDYDTCMNDDMDRVAHLFSINDDDEGSSDVSYVSDDDISIISMSDDDGDDDDGGYEVLVVSENENSDLSPLEVNSRHINVRFNASDVLPVGGELNTHHTCSSPGDPVDVQPDFVDTQPDVAADDGLDDGVGYSSINSNYTESGMKFDLAVKMMFNYNAASNADSILREMVRETVPAQFNMSQQSESINRNKVRKKALPPHPNIVEMWGVFVDPVPNLPDSLYNYPAALPARLNPNGIGRNMTMFLVMKRYQYTLGEYLSTFDPSLDERLMLIGQLLEGVAHMRLQDIAHRDLKLDNIFLDTSKGVVPKLVIGDFGCCLADEEFGMQIPYPSDHTDRGGNTALMAPEISTAVPGLFSYLDYRKSDVWAAATLMYEILGSDNPFYTTHSRQRLDSRTYSMSDLPTLSEKIPMPVRKLIYTMLEREPSKRPSARFAADVLQVLLWAPVDWKFPSNHVSKSDVIWWIVAMATDVLLGTRSAERSLKQSFVQNFSLQNMKQVLTFLDIKM